MEIGKSIKLFKDRFCECCATDIYMVTNATT